jgi:hypothetical protein
MAEEGERAPKLGATALSGYLRQGLAELRAALPLADSPIAQPTNYAMPGMATPGEVTEARREESPELDENSAFAHASIGLDDRGRDDRGLEHDL